MPKGNSLTDFEVAVIKKLLSDGKYTNQEIAGLVNRFRGGASNDVNSGRITNIKQNEIPKYVSIKGCSEQDLVFFFKKIECFDGRTGLNIYDDERVIRSREAMILAVQIFNNPGVFFKTEVFAVLANIAWTYLLHEFYVRRDVEIEDKEGRTFLLSNMLRREDCPLSKGVINNLNDIIDIRHDVEHKILRRADTIFFTKFQTCCLNFDKVLCELFGEKVSLKHDLSFALQFARMDFGHAQILHAFDVPEHIASLDAKLHERLHLFSKLDR